MTGILYKLSKAEYSPRDEGWCRCRDDAWIRDVMCCLPGVRPPTGPATGLVLARGMKKFLSQVTSL